MVCTNHSLKTLFLQIFFADLVVFSLNVSFQKISIPPLQMVNRISQTVKTLRLKAEDFLVSFAAVCYTLQCHRAMHDDPKNDCEGDYKRLIPHKI